MSWVRIWIHIVFSTKNWEPYFHSRELRLAVFQHIKQNAREKDIWLDCVNGYHEHAHCLIALDKDQPLSKIVQLIKGESSHWINKHKLTSNKFVKFAWQNDYWAVGVSESHMKKVRNYIHNQAKHHKSQSFIDEMNAFSRKYGWKLSKE